MEAERGSYGGSFRGVTFTGRRGRRIFQPGTMAQFVRNLAEKAPALVNGEPGGGLPGRGGLRGRRGQWYLEAPQEPGRDGRVGGGREQGPVCDSSLAFPPAWPAAWVLCTS